MEGIIFDVGFSGFPPITSKQAGRGYSSLIGLDAKVWPWCHCCNPVWRNVVGGVLCFVQIKPSIPPSAVPFLDTLFRRYDVEVEVFSMVRENDHR